MRESMTSMTPGPRRTAVGSLLLACALVAITSARARAQTQIDVDVAFSGTIAPTEIVNLVAPGGTVNGPVVNNGQLWFNNSDITFLSVSSAISGSGAVLFIQPVNVTLSGSNSYTGGTIIYGGTTTVTGAIQGGSGILEVDGLDSTMLAISGTVVNGNAFLASTAGQVGDVTVSPGGSWTSSGILYAGFSGTSTVNLVGGAISAGTSYFGRQNGSLGTLLLSSGTFASSGSIYFGYEGASNVDVGGGSLVSVGDMFLGYLGTASGTLASGTISAGGTLTVGKESVASLTVNGGSLSSAAGVIGQTTSGTGTVTVNASLWQVTNDLEVGSTSGGVGNLLISGGGVTSGRGLVGNLAGSTGRVTITSGSWAINGSDPNGNLQVGSFGTGTMTVLGGLVTAAGANIGNNSTGNGTVIVNGGQLSISGLTNIGNFARGSLSLLGGSIFTGQVVVGAENFLGNQGRGTVTVSGGSWISSLSFTVGQGGNGTYAQTGGYVAAAAGYIGSANLLATGGTGSVLVTGGTLAYGGNLTLGNPLPGSTGSGTLTIGSGGGYVSVADTLYRAPNGTLNLLSGGTLSIGVGGTTGALATGVVNDGLLIFDRSTDYLYLDSISGTGAVSKFGFAMLSIGGTNTYSGPTNVFSGTLNLLGRLGATALTVHGGAVFSGTGVTAGSVTISPNGTISPGTGGVGPLTVGDYFMTGSSAVALLQITGSTTPQYDRVLAFASNTLSWGGGSLSIAMSGTPTYVEGTEFYLFSGFGSYSGVLSGISLEAAGTNYANLYFTDAGGGLWESNRNILYQYLRFNTNTGTLVVVPEPSTMISTAVGLGCCTAAGWRWRRRRSRAGPRGPGRRGRDRGGPGSVDEDGRPPGLA